MIEHTTPADIERTSMAVISAELRQRGIVLPPEQAPVILRVIHATADFDYAENLCFTPDAVEKGAEALRNGTPVVTDTNMAKAGISRTALDRLGGECLCFMADPQADENARRNGTTRASAAVDLAAARCPGAVLAVGNAPTALLRIAERMAQGLRPALIVAVPVGFVNVETAKTELFAACETWNVPAIAAMGRKGGSTVAAAIVNALLYLAGDMLDPAARGWH